MTATDVDQLVEMGFDKERAEMAMSKTGGCECSRAAGAYGAMFPLSPMAINDQYLLTSVRLLSAKCSRVA